MEESALSVTVRRTIRERAAERIKIGRDVAMNSVAICIPTYNQAAYLPETVRSAYSQNEPVEVWLSDDCSRDDTGTVVADLQREFPALRAFRQETNLGMSGNPRWIVSQPKTDLIVKLDSDDRLHPEYVGQLAALLSAHPQAGYAHCSVLQIDEEGNTTRTRRLSRRTGFQSAEESLKALPSGFRVAANICMFRREALAAVDFYKKNLGFCDDWDLAVRLADAGWGNVYDEAILASYRVWGGAGNARARRVLAEATGSVRVFEEALEPAYRRRRWDLAPLIQARENRALGLSIVLSLPGKSTAERTELTEALLRLGASPRLERRLKVYRLGFGPMLRWNAHLQVHAKDAIKALLRRGTS